MAPAHTLVCLQVMGAETVVTTIVEMIIKVIMRIEEVLVVEMIVRIIMMTMDMAVSYNRGRSNYHNNAGGDDNQMETQRDTIFIQNFAPTITPDGLKEFFSQIGIIKVRYHYLNSFDIFNENLCYSFDRMIEKQMHQKFRFIKTKQLVTTKVKQELLMKMKSINWYNGKLLLSYFI
jgi:RNA recognition motif-containing protein